MCRHYLIQLLLWVGVWEFSTCCSYREGTKFKTFTMEQVLNLAPVVVSGTDIHHYELPEHVPYSQFTFNVSCVFKSGGLEIPRTIFLLDVGATSCDATHLHTVGRSYIVALKWPTNYWGLGSDSDIPLYFMMAEPHGPPMSSAAFEASDRNLYVASRICSVNDTIEDLGEGTAGDHNCPASGPVEQCISGAKEPFVCLTTVFMVLAYSVILMNYN